MTSRLISIALGCEHIQSTYLGSVCFHVHIAHRQLHPKTASVAEVICLSQKQYPQSSFSTVAVQSNNKHLVVLHHHWLCLRLQMQIHLRKLSTMVLAWSWPWAWPLPMPSDGNAATRSLCKFRTCRGRILLVLGPWKVLCSPVQVESRVIS